MLIQTGLDETKKEHEDYQLVKTHFENHFVKRRNVIFERARFNKRSQQDGESVESFMLALYSLAEHCSYGSLHTRLSSCRSAGQQGVRNTSVGFNAG